MVGRRGHGPPSLSLSFSPLPASFPRARLSHYREDDDAASTFLRPSPDEESGNIELSGPAVAGAPPAGLPRALVGEGEYLLMRKEEEEVACRLPRLRKDLRK